MLNLHRLALCGLSAIALVLAWGSVASAMPVAGPADFAPFTIEKTVWNNRLTSFGPGTETFLIEYRSRDDWKVTQLSHSYTASRAGTTWTFNGALVEYDALRQQTQVRPGPNIVDNWIQPGMRLALERSSRAKVAPASGGGTEITMTETSNGHTSTTTAVFDVRTELPSTVEVRRDGVLLESYRYVRR